MREFFRWLAGTDRVLTALNHLSRKVDRIMATQAQIAAELTTLKDQLVKVGNETTTLIQKVADLEAAIANGPVTPELQAAFDAVKAQVQAVDDLVPDAAP